MEIKPTDIGLVEAPFTPASGAPHHQAPMDPATPVPGAPIIATRRVGIKDFDWYERSGVLLIMYGWWKILSHQHLTATIVMALGFFFTFSHPSKRDNAIKMLLAAAASAAANMSKMLRSEKNGKE